MTQPIANPVHPMLTEHIRGDSYRKLARRYGVSRETARRIVLDQGSSLIRDLERDLIEALALEAEGQEAVWPTCLIPNQMEPDRRDALTMFFWSVDRLKDRGLDVQIVTRPSPAGVAFQLVLPRRTDDS